MGRSGEQLMPSLLGCESFPSPIRRGFTTSGQLQNFFNFIHREKVLWLTREKGNIHLDNRISFYPDKFRDVKKTVTKIQNMPSFTLDTSPRSCQILGKVISHSSKDILVVLPISQLRGVQTKRDRRKLSSNSTLKINVNGTMTRDSGGGAKGASSLTRRSANEASAASGVSEAARLKRLK